MQRPVQPASQAWVPGPRQPRVTPQRLPATAARWPPGRSGRRQFCAAACPVSPRGQRNQRPTSRGEERGEGPGREKQPWAHQMAMQQTSTLRGWRRHGCHRRREQPARAAVRQQWPAARVLPPPVPRGCPPSRRLTTTMEPAPPPVRSHSPPSAGPPGVQGLQTSTEPPRPLPTMRVAADAADSCG